MNQQQTDEQFWDEQKAESVKHFFKMNENSHLEFSGAMRDALEELKD